MEERWAYLILGLVVGSALVGMMLLEERNDYKLQLTEKDEIIFEQSITIMDKDISILETYNQMVSGGNKCHENCKWMLPELMCVLSDHKYLCEREMKKSKDLGKWCFKMCHSYMDVV